jgi:glycosyltransferase involved in cell wall biosynthesis
VFLVAFDSYSFVQRKNPVGVLEAFRKAFPNGENVRLIVKTQNRDNISGAVQARIWQNVEAICARDSRIVVMNETLSYDKLLELKAGVDCYISLHKSEGFGFGMLEAMNLKVPVVCTG